MRRLSTLLAVLAISFSVPIVGCGGDDSGDELAKQVEAAKDEQTPKGQLGSCLADAGFIGSDEIVGTVVIEEAKQIAVAQVPGREGEFLVVYQAASEAEASQKAADYQGGPFAEAVDDKIYTFTSDVPSSDQKDAIRQCLAGAAAGEEPAVTETPAAAQEPAGDDEAAVIAVARDYYENYIGGNGETACAAMTQKGQAQVVSEAGIPDQKTCEGLIENLSALLAEAEAGRPENVQVEGDSASLIVPFNKPYKDQSLQLVRKGDNWLIDSFKDVP